MLSIFKTFLSDETGSTAIEYGLIIALVSVASIAAMSSMGEALATIFNQVTTALDTQILPPAP